MNARFTVTLFGLAMFFVGLIIGQSKQPEVIRVADDSLKHNLEFCFGQLRKEPQNKDDLTNVKYELEKLANKCQPPQQVQECKGVQELRSLITDLKEQIAKRCRK